MNILKYLRVESLIKWDELFDDAMNSYKFLFPEAELKAGEFPIFFLEIWRIKIRDDYPELDEILLSKYIKNKNDKNNKAD
jgi:hypothetical protein